MKIKPKNRKVQAQRKFAQGAFVPPSNNVPERRRDVTPKDEGGANHRMGQNTMVKMPAKSLLDVVSFKSIHNHVQPLVLLKRLNSESSAENVTRTTVKEKPPENDNYAVNEITSLFKVRRYSPAKQQPGRIMKAKALHTMKLRSRKRQPAKKQPKAPKRPLPKQPPTVRAKRQRVVPPPPSEFSVDDYKPLTYFTKKVPEPATPVKQPEPPRPPAPVKPTPGPLQEIIDVSDTQSQFGGTLPTSEAALSEELLSSISLAMDRRVISLADLLKFSSGSPSDLNKKLIANGLPPLDRAQASNVVDKLKEPYYSSSQIARWVDACRQTVSILPNEIAVDMFKAPLPPPPSLLHKRHEHPTLDIARGDDDTISVNSFIENNDCPSLKYITVKDVLVAPKREIESRCKKCQPCSRVEKVHTIANLVLMPLGDNVNLTQDIYEFKPNDDMAISNTRMSHYRGENRQVRQNSNTEASTSRGTTTVNDGESLYLDILPEHGTHIIQIMSIANSTKSLRARLIPKSQVTSANELSLIEHENLLDQLVITLKASNPNARELLGPSDSWPQVVEPCNSDVNTETPADAIIDHNSEVLNDGTDTLQEHSVAGDNKEDSIIEENTITDQHNTGNTEFDESNNDIVEGISNQANLTRECIVLSTRLPIEGTSSHFRITNINKIESVNTVEVTETPSRSKERETRSSEAMKSTHKQTFPKSLETGKLVDAPVFHPTEAEFQDPIAYFEKIMPKAAKFGLCKIVAPAGFKPKCNSSDDIRFNVMNQYVARMYSRWGPAQREMCAIKAYLSSQSVSFNRAPLLDYMEVDLPKLYHMVQDNGGLKKVIEKKRWSRVAEYMCNSRCPSPGNKLDYIYLKYLLPYGTLSHQERYQMTRKVERCWVKKNRKMLERAVNPLHRQKKLLGESESSSEDDEEYEGDKNVALALREAEDCVVLGRHMNLAMFKRTAANMMAVHFPRSRRRRPTLADVEAEYWKIVLLGASHVCVNSASIDTGTEGYGFTKNKNDPYGKHPWNLKMLSQNPGNVLRSLGPVLGVTVPTLHLGMLYSTSCWHRDPHGLPWIEYMHNGPHKIWYGIPDEQSDNFRKAVEKLCPTSCQNKSIWLPSDIAMIPPRVLCDHEVSLSRVAQRPAEFIIVFPKAYSCSIATGYTQSESVYFASNSWLNTVHQTFEEVRRSCEPTMFSLEQLLISVAKDPKVTLAVLHQVHAHLSPIVKEELANRRSLKLKGLKFSESGSARKPKPRRRAGAWNVREQDECELCRTTLYFSKVTNITGNKTCVCLRHALQLIDLPKYSNKDRSTFEVVLLFPDNELQTILNNVHKKLSL